MLHRPADSRLLSNLLSHEKDYVRSLYSQLDYGQASLSSFSAYAAASPPPASRAIGFVAGALVGAHDALRAYVLAVDEWCEQLKTLKDVEEEVGNIARDREILVDRLIKASKSNNPKRRSIMSSGASSSPSAAGFSSSTLTLEHLSFSNSKLNLAQNELQACETHLTEKEHILAQMRENIMVGGLKARCKALVECGWKWAESGKASLKALDGSVVRGNDEHSGVLSQKPLPNPHDFNARPSSDLSSSLAPSQSASQIFSTDMVSEQFHISSGTSSHIRHGPLPEADIHDDSSQFVLSVPPAHAISEQDHYVPSRIQTSSAAIGDSESSSDDETDERIYEVVENKLFSDSSPVAKTAPKKAGPKTRLPSKRQDHQMISNGAGLPASISAPLHLDYANTNGLRRDAHGAFSSSYSSQQSSPRRRKAMSFLGLGAITGLFHRCERTSSLSLVPGASTSFPISGSAPASPKRGGQWLTRTNQNLKKVGQADNSSDEDITKQPGGSDTAINYAALRKKSTAPSFYSGSAVTEAGPGSLKISKKSRIAGEKLRKPMDVAFAITSGTDIPNTRTGLEDARKTGKKLVRENPATNDVNDAQAQSTGNGHSVIPLPASVSRTSTMQSQVISRSQSSARAASFNIPSAVSDKRRVDTRSDPGCVPAGRMQQQTMSSAPARRGQASLMSIIEDVSQRNRQGWLQANPNSLLVEIKAPKSVHTSTTTSPETFALPSTSLTSPSTTSYGRSGPVGRRRDASSMEMQNAVVQRLSTISASSSEPSLPLKNKSAKHYTQRETPAAQRPPLRSALRNRTPSPNPSSFSTLRNGNSVQNGGDTRVNAEGDSILITKPLKSNSNDDDSVSVSSAYETGQEDFGDASDPLPLPPPPDRLPDGLVTVQLDGTQLSGSASSSGGTVTRPSRRKSVRVSMPPTFSPTPPALTDYDEGDYAPWASASVKERPISSTWSSRVAEPNTGWENSSDEDEDYSRARQMLYTASKKLEIEVHRNDLR